MIFFQSVRGDREIGYEEDEIVQLCPRCSMPNKMSSMYCEDCMGSLRTPRDDHRLGMQASRIVKCAQCGWYNAIGATHCANRNCNFRFSDAATDEDVDENPDIGETSEPIYVKVCPECRHENPAAIDKCENCDANISAVFEEEKRTGYMLLNLATRQSVMLCDTEHQTIGREYFLCEQLTGHSYVGRAHAELFCRNQQWFICDRSTNGTYLNGERIEKGVDIALERGMTISLGDPSEEEPLAAHFRFDYAD